MAGLDSGIKCHKETQEHIELLEKTNSTKDDGVGYLILRIGKKVAVDHEGHECKEKVDKVLVEHCMTIKECDEKAKEEGFGDLKGDETPTWACFRKKIMSYDIAYGCCFMHWTTNDGRKIDKLVFVTWNPEKAKMKEKMTYSSTKIINKFKNINLKIQASDSEDICFNTVKGQIKL